MKQGYRGFRSRAAYEAHYSDPANYAAEMSSMEEYAREALGERAVIRVGDHTPEPVTVVVIDPFQKRKAELWAVRKMRPSLEEFRALAERFADAVQLMQVSITNEHFAGVRSAHLSVDEIAQQTIKVNTGIKHAIEACNKREF